METEIKLCECGCGQPAPIAKENDRCNGAVKGQPKRFINHHCKATTFKDKHGMSRSRESSSYRAAKKRCACKPGSTHWENYAGRGIKFLFDSFEQFFTELGPRPEGTTLDRFPNQHGNYEPGNVRWAAAKEQANNKRYGNQWGKAA